MEATTIPLTDTRDLARVRDTLRRWAKELGFSTIRMTKVMTAASELARNTVIHGGGGEATLEVVHGPKGRIGIKMRFVDRGPGIADVQLAMTDGYTTGGGLGLGLSGAQRLLGELSIETASSGTVIEGVAWRR